MENLSPPKPWRLVAEVAVGGLHSIGFVPCTEDLLVVSQQGRGLLDATSGNRIVRDSDDSWAWYREDPPSALALGQHAHIWVSVAGLGGGSLPTATQDGWALSLGKDERLYLAPPGGVPCPFSPRWEGEPVRAFGFSDSGRCLAVAVSSHTLELYERGIVAAG